jgi:NAD(P) transhydrogenase subunit beta
VLIAFAVVNNPEAFGIPVPLPGGNRVELFIGTFVGAMTFSGSVIAFGKLAGLGNKFRLFSSAPIVFKGQQIVNLLMAIAMLGFGIAFFLAPVDGQWPPFVTMTAIAFVLGVLIIIPIGGADMPVVISMLNSYSGWAASGIGFTLNNPLLIVAGSLVGSSGAILSYIMCKAMNRSFISVILGGFGAAEGATAGAAEQRSVRSGSPDDVAFLLGNAESVIIVPWLWPRRRTRAARGQGDGAEAHRQRRERALCDPPGRRPHAGTHERAAGGSRGSIRSGLRDGGHQQRLRHPPTSPSCSAPTTS